MSNYYIKELNFAIIQSVKNSYLYIKENILKIPMSQINQKYLDKKDLEKQVTTTLMDFFNKN